MNKIVYCNMNDNIVNMLILITTNADIIYALQKLIGRQFYPILSYDSISISVRIIDVNGEERLVSVLRIPLFMTIDEARCWITYLKLMISKQPFHEN